MFPARFLSWFQKYFHCILPSSWVFFRSSWVFGYFYIFVICFFSMLPNWLRAGMLTLHSFYTALYQEIIFLLVSPNIFLSLSRFNYIRRFTIIRTFNRRIGKKYFWGFITETKKKNMYSCKYPLTHNFLEEFLSEISW